MTDEKAPTAAPRSPYDLWPDQEPAAESVENGAEVAQPEPVEQAAPQPAEPDWHVAETVEIPQNNTTEPFIDVPEWNSSPDTGNVTEAVGWQDQPAPAFDPPPVQPEPASFDAPFEAKFIPVAYTPESTDETVRRSGLAWSAGVVFFGSVAFMLLLGWLADLLLGSAPWGLVGGIILGAIIGFMQFFRISSQIFNNSDKGPAPRPLMGPRDED